MDKVQMYRAVIDCAIFVRNFIFQQPDFYSRRLDDALQPLIDGAFAQLKELVPKSKDSDDNVSA